MDLLFGQSDEMSENQPTLGLDDGAGLRVVKARFVSQRKFDWELFAGYDQLRVLTYSASVNAIVRMLNQFSFSAFECVKGGVKTYQRGVDARRLCPPKCQGKMSSE